MVCNTPFNVIIIKIPTLEALQVYLEFGYPKVTLSFNRKKLILLLSKTRPLLKWRVVTDGEVVSLLYLFGND